MIPTYKPEHVRHMAKKLLKNPADCMYDDLEHAGAMLLQLLLEIEAEEKRFNGLFDDFDRVVKDRDDLRQTSMELCGQCGWRTLMPGEGCYKCEAERLREALGYALQAWQYDGISDEHGSIALEVESRLAATPAQSLARLHESTAENQRLVLRLAE